MAGHNKWSQIKNKKAATDAKKSKTFGTCAKLITLESKRVGGNVEDPSLRSAIERARAVNMPKENIERAIQKGKSGTADMLLRVTYETYGPGGCAILIDTVTDNRNRTSQELRHLLAGLGYALAEPGSASWAFKKMGGVWEPTTNISLSDENEKALEKLLESLDEHDDVENVFVNVA